MKKTLIAGAASLALAAMPVLGVFAAGEPAEDPADIVDTLTVNVNGICSFTRTGGTGTYTQTMTANAIKNDFGSSTFTTECNNGKGYAVTAVFTSIAHTASEGTPITYDAAATLAAGAGKWQAYKSAPTPAGNINNNGVAHETSGPDAPTGTFTVDYKVATNAVQSMGTYTGTATYTLAQKTT